MSKISHDIRTRIQDIIAEQNTIIFERSEVIHGIWVGRIAQEHLIMFGPGGTAKTFLAHNTASHITDAVPFETALDEQSVPDQLFGPPDIKGMVEHGKTRRIVTGMLPEATDAFVDEVMNANATVKHSLQPLMNERVFHNNGMPMSCPLRQLLAGTNKNGADTDPNLAPFFDRFHLRYTVGYLKQRSSRFDMVTQAIARLSVIGRGTGTSALPQKTGVTLAELDTAHAEALALDVADPTMTLIDDIWEELAAKGIILSDRRYVEGYAAVLANAWLRGHEQVQPQDLDILTYMWWSIQELAGESRNVILGAANPGEKAALDLLDELDKFKAELKAAADSDMDTERQRRLGVEQVRNADKLLRDAQAHLKTSKAAGLSTARLEETIARAQAFKLEIAKTVFNLDPASLVAAP